MRNYQTLLQFDFHRRVAQIPGVSVLFFTAAGCGSCRRWRQVLAECLAVDGDLTVLEVDAGNDQGLAREYGVHHLPALFLFKDGHYHCPLESEAHPGRLRQAIQAALARPAEDPP